MFKEKSKQMYPVMGEKQMSKRLGGIKGCKVLKEKSERYITSRNGWESLKGIRGDQRLQLQNFFMALGLQYSNLNRHVSTQEKQNQRQYSTPSSMVL